MIDDPSKLGIKGKKYLSQESKRSQVRNDKSISLKSAFRSKAFWLLSIVGFLTYFIHTGVNIHQAAYLIDKGFVH